MPNQPKKDITPEQPVSTGRVTRSQSPAVTETTAAMEPDNDSLTVADLYKLMKATKSENSTNYNSLKTQLTGMDHKLLQIISDITNCLRGCRYERRKHLNWTQASHSKVKRPHYQTCTGHQSPIKVGTM